jgi:hypothetical protein
MRAIRDQRNVAGRFASSAPCAFIVASLLACFACNDVGDCPAPEAIIPGASCSGDALECPYNLASPSAACDGTSVDGGVATSCVCMSGNWVCPTPVTCMGAGADAADDAAPGAGVEAGVEPSDVFVVDALDASGE